MRHCFSESFDVSEKKKWKEINLWKQVIEWTDEQIWVIFLFTEYKFSGQRKSYLGQKIKKKRVLAHLFKA